MFGTEGIDCVDIARCLAASELRNGACLSASALHTLVLEISAEAVLSAEIRMYAAHTNTYTHTCTRTHARTHARTCTHTLRTLAGSTTMLKRRCQQLRTRAHRTRDSALTLAYVRHRPERLKDDEEHVSARGCARALRAARHALGVHRRGSDPAQLLCAAVRAAAHGLMSAAAERARAWAVHASNMGHAVTAVQALTDSAVGKWAGERVAGHGEGENEGEGASEGR